MATIPGTLNTNLTDEQVLEAFDNALTHTPSDSTPKEDGSGSAGEAETFARSDHEHPHDTTKQDTVLGSWTPDTSATHQTPAGTDTVLEALQKIDRNQRADETNISLLQRAHVSQTFVFPDLTWTATGGGVYVSNGTSIIGIDKIESIVITGFNNIRTTDIISALTTNDRKQVRFVSNVTTFAHSNSGFDLYITGTPSNS